MNHNRFQIRDVEVSIHLNTQGRPAVLGSVWLGDEYNTQVINMDLEDCHPSWLKQQRQRYLLKQLKQIVAVANQTHAAPAEIHAQIAAVML
jgi:hypothetical protein